MWSEWTYHSWFLLYSLLLVRILTNPVAGAKLAFDLYTLKIYQVALNGAVCVEEFANSRALGRVFLRSSGRTIAVGIVTRIIDRQES